MDLRALIAGTAFALMWSSAFASARIILAGAPPLHALTLRFLISGLMAVGIARALGQGWRLDGPRWRAVIVFGLCQNALYLGLNFVAMQWIEASIASIIASAMQLIVALLGWVFLGERVAPMGVFGLLAGFSGVALIMGTRISGGADPLGLALCVAGATALGVATLVMRGASMGGNVLMIVGLQMLVGSAALGLVAFTMEPGWIHPSAALALAFAYQILVPGLAATLIWFWLVARLGAVRASTFHFLNPFFGVVVAALLLGESIGPWDMAGVGIAMAGILAVQLSKSRPSPSSL